MKLQIKVELVGIRSIIRSCMKRIFLCACIALQGLMVLADSRFSDEAVKSVLSEALDYYHGDGMSREFRRAFLMCDSQSNRFARLIRELSMTNDVMVTERMLLCLGKYGSAQDVEFLNNCVERGRAPVAAAKAILHIEGVCSNSISAWARSVAWTNAAVSLGERLGYYYMDCATNTTVDVECQTMIKRELAHHAINHYFYNPWYDQKMTNVFPDYTYSFARLQALSNGLGRNTFYYNLNYITNALRELSEIPASEFHEFP